MTGRRYRRGAVSVPCTRSTDGVDHDRGKKKKVTGNSPTAVVDAMRWRTDRIAWPVDDGVQAIGERADDGRKNNTEHW